MKKLSFGIDSREPMSRTGNNFKKLRNRIDKIENLWSKKQKQSLAKMSMYSNDGKGHSGEITESIADKYFSRKPIIPEQAKRRADKGKYHGNCEHLVFTIVRNVNIIQLEE